jgi:hypothetical protein
LTLSGAALLGDRNEEQVEDNDNGGVQVHVQVEGKVNATLRAA